MKIGRTTEIWYGEALPCGYI